MKPEQNAATALIAQPSSATPDARKVHRAVMGWLEQAYDEDKRRYQPGFNDQKIADETGASVAYVGKVRDDFFGPVAPPSEFQEIKADIDRIEREARAALDLVLDQVAAVRTSIATIAKANGWAA